MDRSTEGKERSFQEITRHGMITLLLGDLGDLKKSGNMVS